MDAHRGFLQGARSCATQRRATPESFDFQLLVFNERDPDGAPGEPMTLDPGQAACDEAARSIEEVDAANSGHDEGDIGPPAAEVKARAAAGGLTFGTGEPI
jgi:hypothetical protein